MPADRRTEAEETLLSLILREVRHVAATREQLSILIDPFIDGSGAHVSFHFNGAGWTKTLEGKLRKRRKRSRRA